MSENSILFSDIKEKKEAIVKSIL